ncbi:MAG TPA: SLC13 family permease [Opitutales bacterium]|nr:SLC13 family permease [Opitutales bacterium]
MSLDAWITLAVIAIALILFVKEVYSIEVVALAVMVTFVLTGVITPADGIKGFANPATVTIGSLFVISDAFIRTGFIHKLAPLFSRLLGMTKPKAITGMSMVIGSVSAFVNNTPIVATFIPVASTAARRNDYPPSRFLIPLSYVAILGGCCTLIGTSTNLLVSSIAQDAGEPGFTMFLMTPLGLVFAVVGTIYLASFGSKLVPERSITDFFDKSEQISDFETEILVTKELAEGKDKLGDLLDLKDSDESITIMEVRRRDQITEKPEHGFRLKKDDLLHLRGDMDRIRSVLREDGLTATKQKNGETFPNETTRMLQVFLLPHSSLSDRKLGQSRFLERYRAEILGLRSRGRDRFSNLEDVVLRPGDVLLLQTDETGLELLREAELNQESPFLSLTERKLEGFHPLRMWLVVAMMVCIVTASALGFISIMIGALTGVILLNLFRVISPQEAYHAIDWKVIFLIAGALSMGKAIESSGIAKIIGNFLVDGVGSALGPVAIISALYLITVILTELMSNNAAAAVTAPIALAAADAIEVNATPLLLAVAFAGSASFITPVGYQTNTMVYSAGNYRFTDFARVGIPLSLMLWMLASFLIPVFYPL